MRIPIYRTRATPTNEAPGRSFQTRKNARTFVQAELDKAKPAQAVTEAIGSYALYRYNMAEALKLDEANIEVQDELRNLASDLSAQRDLTALDEGGSWYRESTKIKDRILSKLGKNKNTLQKFNATYLLSESNNRFSLRGNLESAKKTGLEEAEKKLNDLIVGDLIESSKLFTKESQKIEEYDTKLGAWVQGQLSKINKIGFDPTVIENNFREMRVKIAEGVLTSVVANDPFVANKIITYIPDMLEKAKIDNAIRDLEDQEIPEDLLSRQAINQAKLANLARVTGVETDYLVHVMSKTRDVDIVAMTTKAFSDAMDFTQDRINFEKLAEDRQEEQQQDALDFYNKIYLDYLSDTNASYSRNDIKNAVPDMLTNPTLELIVANAFGTEEKISAANAQSLLKNIITLRGVDNTMVTVLEQNDILSQSSNPEGGFRSDDDADAQQLFIRLTEEIDIGILSRKELTAQAFNLSSSQYNSLNSQLKAGRNDAYNKIKSNVRFLFDQSLEKIPPGGFNQEKFDGFVSVMSSLGNYLEQNPLATPMDLREQKDKFVKIFGKTLLNEAEQIIIDAIKSAKASLELNKIAQIPDPIFKNNVLTNRAEIEAALRKRIENANSAQEDTAILQNTTITHHFNFLEKLAKEM